MSRKAKVAIGVVITLVVLYLAYREWYISTQCFGNIGGTYVCK